MNEQPLAEHLVSCIERGTGHQIRIKLLKLKRGIYIDMRLWYLDENTNNWLPTKKGITAPVEVIDDLVNSLKEADHFLEEREL